MTPHISSATEHLNKLQAFRQSAYDCFGPARDALFELGDAVLLTPTLNSFAELSLCPAFRRSWPSLYEAVQDGCPNHTELLNLYLRHIDAPGRLVLAGDHTAWSRLSAYTLRERTIEHQPNKIPGAKPLTLGHGFSTLVWLPDTPGSWALPLLHERITPREMPRAKMTAQLRVVCAQTPTRPVALLDAEYGCAPFLNDSADIPCDLLFRLRPNLCLRRAPEPYKGRGRRPKHGRKFKLRDARTWGMPCQTLELDDPQLGPVRVSLWADLHFQKAAAHPFWVLRLERLKARDTRRDRKVLWLAWHGQPPPPLAAWWKQYLRRFGVDHWYRFSKQQLHWTLPRFKTPEQAECWSALMPLVTWQLWLARSVVTDKPLPWQKAQPQLTPGRVRQSIGAILTQIGTPTRVPKPRGKSAGWPSGRRRQRAPRYPIAKKTRRRTR